MEKLTNERLRELIDYAAHGTKHGDPVTREELAAELLAARECVEAGDCDCLGREPRCRACLARRAYDALFTPEGSFAARLSETEGLLPPRPPTPEERAIKTAAWMGFGPDSPQCDMIRKENAEAERVAVLGVLEKYTEVTPGAAESLLRCWDAWRREGSSGAHIKKEGSE